MDCHGLQSRSTRLAAECIQGARARFGSAELSDNRCGASCWSTCHPHQLQCHSLCPHCYLHIAAEQKSESISNRWDHATKPPITGQVSGSGGTCPQHALLQHHALRRSHGLCLRHALRRYHTLPWSEPVEAAAAATAVAEVATVGAQAGRATGQAAAHSWRRRRRRRVIPSSSEGSDAGRTLSDPSARRGAHQSLTLQAVAKARKAAFLCAGHIGERPRRALKLAGPRRCLTLSASVRGAAGIGHTKRDSVS